jgi:signal transduction histidine kinase
MGSWSLRKRLIFLAALTVSFVLAIAGMTFSMIYKKHVENFVLTELSSHLEQLLGGTTLNSNKAVDVGVELSDPRFHEPGGGLYWQIDVPGKASLRSRSLWDEQLTIPTPPQNEEHDHAHILNLPSGGEIFALEKLVVLTGEAGTELPVVVTVGIDRDRVTSPVSAFLQAILGGLAATYAVLLASMIFILTLGLRPLAAVKQQIVAMRNGSTRFDASGLPSEVLPLAEEVNALSIAREQQLESARQRASNLAHGLKTPLAVMLAISNELRGRGLADAADHISLNANQMRDLVDRELTRSRMADGRGNYRADLADTVRKVVATMKKAPRGDLLMWSVDVPDNAHVSVDRVDLLELLGNLLDNARKHATEAVRVSHDGRSLVIEDDGLGVPEEQMGSILQRGVRLDEKMPGSGIGLAIVTDLADVYGLTLNVRRSDLGGLAIEVGMPVL